MRGMRLALMILLGCALVCAALPGIPADAAMTPTPSSVYASSSREVCHLPLGGNKQRVLGFDVGFSTSHPESGQTLWFFGDTYVDGNKDGVFNGGFEFRTGTIARSSDKNPNNCFNLKWKTNEKGTVANMLQPTGDECLTWPDGAIDLDGTMYVYFTGVHAPKCADDPEETSGASSFTQGLLRVTNTTTLATERVADLWGAGELGYGMPFRIGNYVYLFANEKLASAFGVTYVHIARVPATAASLANKNAYQYLSDSGWTSDASQSKRSFYASTAAGPVTLAYNKLLGRYLAVYGCNYTQICASTPASASDAEDALTGDWNAPTLLVDCGGEVWSCYQGAQHPEFASADGSTLIITAARHDDPHYWVTVREVKISATPPAFSRERVDGQRDFFAPHEVDDASHSTSEQGGRNWTYVSWPSRTPLTWENIIRPNPTDPTKSVTCSRAWVGTETTAYAKPPKAPCQDVPLRAPRVFPNGAVPGVTQDVARIWTAPAPGTVAVNGVAWVERTCGDGTTLEIALKSGTVTRTIFRKALTPKWAKTREVRVNPSAFLVLAGDEVIVHIDRGTQTGYCDRTYFNPTMVYDQASLHRDAISDFRDDPGQGFHGWTYEICARNNDVVSSCSKMNAFDIGTGQGQWTNIPVFPLGPADGSLMTPTKEIPPSVAGTVISRTWTAPSAGKLHVKTRVRDMEPPATCGPDDGVRAAAYVGNTRVWPAGPSWQTVVDAQTPLVEFDTTVAAGDQLRFLVDSGPVSTCDNTRFAPTLDFTWK